MVVKDLANEFAKSFNILDMIDYKRDVEILFSEEGGRYIPEQLWERYKDFNKETVLGFEKKYPELADIRESIEKSAEIMNDVYDLVEKSAGEKTEKFWNQIKFFLEETKKQWEKFKINKESISQKILN